MSKTEQVKIGLETHLQLNTESKLFCSCSNSSSEEPNSNVCEICLGMPGSKPAINQKAIDFSLKAALALDCGVNQRFHFSRKTYFYPDMSKDYQITQYELPVGLEGKVKLDDEHIRIRRVHLEEDPAKLIHKGESISESDYTLIDYNRAGVPLIEVVTEPDLSSPEQARELINTLVQIFEYLGIYDSHSDLTIRTDANISIQGGTRVEVKNITGSKALEKALRYELRRQRNLKNDGREIERETRSYDQSQEITFSMRKKEEEKDYGYIFEPDLSGFKVDQDKLNELKKEIPQLPHERLNKFVDEFGVDEELAESLVTDLNLSKAFESVRDEVGTDLAASWFSGPIKKTLNYHGINFSESGLKEEWLVEILKKLKQGELSDRSAELVVREIVEDPRKPQKIIEENDLARADQSESQKIIKEVLDDNQDALEDLKKGKEEAINFLVGQVMQESQGKVDPKEAREVIMDSVEN